MFKIKLTKIETPDDAKHNSPVEIGKPYIGEFMFYPKKGECFFMGREDAIFRTSTVQEILDYNIFKTKNSIYKIESVN